MSSKIYTGFCFAVFLIVNLFAAHVNHIDDTDETYGYWEVLHYLLFGKGMQTWEYAPQFAIRTYAFIFPLVPLGKLCSEMSFNLSKLDVFYVCRFTLGVVSASAEAHFVTAIGEAFGPALMRFTMFFLIFSPGVFFASTAYLPSAVSSSLLMFACADWLRNRNAKAIFWGALAVLCTGWPFVVILFLPLGLHMLAGCFSPPPSGDTKETTTPTFSPVGSLGMLIFSGVLILLFVGSLAAAIDAHMYGRWTSPTLNILLYNALGSGDELYGIEPTSYYIRNLFLNLGLAWPLGAAAPILLLRNYLNKSTDDTSAAAGVDGREAKILVLCASAVLWLGILFSRPHKEERFMYPIYPLLTFLASYSLMQFVDVVFSVFATVLGEQTPLASIESFFSSANTKKKKEEKHEGREEREAALPLSSLSQQLNVGKHLAVALCILITITLCFSRVLSNMNNFSGYMGVWRDLGKHISSHPFEAQRELVVCTGGEWYFFPSHFFLPSNARLEFVSDTFHGQLPQHFHPKSGTSGKPFLPFNDRNKEEISRYVTIDDCDYIVAVMDEELNSLGPMMNSVFAQDAPNFERLVHRHVIDAERSRSALARAFFIPSLSAQMNKFREYTVFKRG